MEQQCTNAQKVAQYLASHPKVEKVYYPGLLSLSDGRQYEIYRKQCSAPGAMLSFDIRGGEKEAFTFLNALKLIKLAVSLGSTESLAEHPATMTHVDIEEGHRHALGITEKMIRLSVGVEHYEDIIWDLEQAFKHV
jgi:methionine-gamma-lyase